MSADRLKDVLAKARAEIAKVVIGQKSVVDMALITIFTGNHALVEGVPGVAKTLLVRALGKVLDCDTQRIQFTPDLMPADILGTNVFNMKENAFILIKGPVFTTFLLADEINRAPAKTQSALLQAMQERRVTIDRETYPLSPHFTVFATQNPIEYEGTYPLPEAQKDRFMFKIPMKCPEPDEELTLARRMLGDDSPEAVLAGDQVQPVIGPHELAALRQELKSVTIREELIGYIVNVVRETRKTSSVLIGAGPRATQALIAASRACAALQDRDFVSPDDIKDMAAPVFVHRLILRPEFEIEGLTVEEVIQQILREVAVPR
ncbi:MAG: MoxR family ATPase [Verrucomicrobiota bacterium]|nr:MoxR family ATPase [Verrucomicrobiota bacterium]